MRKGKITRHRKDSNSPCASYFELRIPALPGEVTEFVEEEKNSRIDLQAKLGVRWIRNRKTRGIP